MTGQFAAETLLKAMLNCERRRDYVALSGHVIYNGDRIVESGDADIVREFGRLMIRAVPAWRYEVKHGQRSLLDPLNEQNICWRIGQSRETSD